MTPSHPETPVGPDATDTTVAPPRGGLRCSDAERERTSAAVHRAVGEGRLSVDEAEKRLTAVFAARYLSELDALTADLPAPDTRGGWTAVFALARQQLVDDVAVLTGRSRNGELSTRRRLMLALCALALCVVVVSVVLLVVHGMVDGPEHGYELER